MKELASKWIASHNQIKCLAEANTLMGVTFNWKLTYKLSLATPRKVRRGYRESIAAFVDNSFANKSVNKYKYLGKLMRFKNRLGVNIKVLFS